MTSLIGKFTSVRRWALLLALLLGAGVMISACGDEETPAPTTPAPPPPTPTPPPEPEPTGPATPENLRVTGTTSTTITWSWNAVEGAFGYEGRFSVDGTFTDPPANTPYVILAPATSHTVSNLSGNMTGHFRVRSGTGTSLDDLTYSEWTDGVSGTTAAAPAAVQLAAPDNVRSTDRSEDSITLEWDDVDGAATYEVEQREPDGDWDDASCGSADEDNVVDEEECVASGLDEGTDYDFRVRGVQAEDDAAHSVGAWSDTFETRTDGTAPGPTTPTTSGGMGSLGVTWTSTADTITWSWNPAAGATYEWDVLDAPVSTAANPCEDVDWTADDLDSGAEFSHEEDSLSAGNVRLLCVRSQDEDNRALSWAWGVPRPAGPTVAADRAVQANDNDRSVTTAVIWQTIGVVADFDYELKVVADPVRGGMINGAGTDDKVVQAACAAGARHLHGDSDVPTTFAETSITSGLKVHTGYLLCLRYANTAGDTGWAVPTVNAEIFTLPGRPSPPRVLAPRVRTTSTTEIVVWHVETRTQTSVPRGDTAGEFEAITISYDETYDDGDSTGIERTTSTPKLADCVASATPTNGTWTVTEVPAASIAVDPTGIVITAASVTRNTDAEAKGDATTAGQGDIQMRLCVRATNGDLDGPWVLGGNREIKRQAPPS